MPCERLPQSQRDLWGALKNARARRYVRGTRLACGEMTLPNRVGVLENGALVCTQIGDLMRIVFLARCPRASVQNHDENAFACIYSYLHESLSIICTW